MTVSTIESKSVQTGDSVVVQFFFNFKILNDSHMLVYIDDILQIGGFIVTSNPDQETAPGGDVTFDVPPFDGLSVTLLREIPLTQLVDYLPYDPFPADTHETALDQLTMVTQQLQEQMDRAALGPPSSDEPAELGEVNTASNIGLGEGVFAQKVEVDLQLKSIIGGAGISVGADATSITISTPAENNDGISLPGDEAIFTQKNGVNLQFKSLIAGDNVGLISDANAITINVDEIDGETNDGNNLGLGEGVFASKTGVNLDFKSLVAGAGIAITGDATSITIADDGSSSVQITTNIPETLEIIEGSPDEFTIDTLVNQANALLQLDADGLVPISLLPFTGLSFFGPFLPESLQVNADNPTTRFPLQVFGSGSWFVISADGWVSTRDASDPDTLPHDIQVTAGDGLFYSINGDPNDDLATDWYWIEDFVASDLILAENVIFDDTNTVIKGINVQVWNEAADAVIDANVADITANTAKLVGIEDGAQVNQGDLEIKQQYEANADTNEFNDAEKVKLAGIADGADVSPPPLSDAAIKTQYENNADTNAFDDAALGKLAGIQAGAEVNQTDVIIKSQYEANADTNALTDALLAKLAIDVQSSTVLIPQVSLQVTNMVQMTQAAYDLLAPPDASTMYVIVG